MNRQPARPLMGPSSVSSLAQHGPFRPMAGQPPPQQQRYQPASANLSRFSSTTRGAFSQQPPSENDDFPALGSSVPSSTNAHNQPQQSYASAGTNGTSTSNATNTREGFSQDDFPALGSGGSAGGNGDAPPGLSNGSGSQSLLGVLQGGPQQQTPGMLNLGPQGRGALRYDDKERKLTQPTQPQFATSTSPAPQTNGVSTTADVSSTAQPTYPQNPSQQVLSSAADRWGLLGLLSALKSTSSQPGPDNVGMDLNNLGVDVAGSGPLHPHLTSPLFPLNSHGSALGSGVAGGVGLPSLWGEPDFDVPAVYPKTSKMPKLDAFSEETLFVMFYSQPRDVAAEIAADALHQRNWRFHTKLRLWITRDPISQANGTVPPSQQQQHQQGNPIVKVPGGESGTWTVFNVGDGVWAKERRDMTVLYSDLEDRPYKGQEALQQLAQIVSREAALERARQQQQHHQQSGGTPGVMSAAAAAAPHAQGPGSASGRPFA